MATCLSFDQIFAAGPSDVRKLKEIGDSYDGPDDPGACQAFASQVNKLECFIKETYRIAMIIARKSEDPDEVVGMLGGISAFCAEAMTVLTELKVKYSYCGTPELYDLVLDYKMACDQRRHNLLSELECPNPLTELFPTPS